tara:strand:- start:9521 stop:10489 length:969 start_codon:yes stop_codon:yes gene_type:complete
MEKGHVVLSGTMRSGTTLMGAILNSHSKVDIVSDTLAWFFKRCAENYGPMSSEFELDDALYSLEPFMQHYQNKYSIESLRAKVIASGISYQSLYNALIEQELGKSPTGLYGVKSTHAAFEYEKILRMIPNTKIIHMVRDCRDVYRSHKVFASKKRSYLLTVLRKMALNSRTFLLRKILNRRMLLDERVFNPYHFVNPQKMIDYWAISNKLAHDLQKAHPDNILIVRYEDLIGDVPFYMRSVIDFLGVQWEEGFHDYNKLKNRDNKKWKANSSFSKDGNNGYDNSRIGTGDRGLRAEELDYLYANASPTLDLFGYDVYRNKAS